MPSYPQDKFIDKKFKEVIQPLIIPNVINNYSIGNANPLQDPTQFNMIYENMLPKTLSISRMNNLVDRNIIYSHVRSNILNNLDGDIVLFKKGPNCIFNKLKTTTFNPYTYNIDGINDNPYKTIPENFLIYQSCYPILYDGIEGSKCKENGTGLNMRIYRLNKGEINKSKDEKIRFNSNVYREIITYQQIKNNILDKKICPNFVMLYGYMLCKESGLNFDSFNIKKYINKNSPLQKYLLTNQDLIEELKQYKKEYNLSITKILNDLLHIFNKNSNLKETFERAMKEESQMNKMREILIKIIKGLPYYNELLKRNKAPVIENDDFYEDDLLMALTESPTYSIFKWLSKVYVNNTKAKVMVSDGIHSLKEWRSIIIQLLCAYHCLIKEKIIIPNFSIRDNVFIKELKTEPSITKYWIYNINGVNHYVPNMGYLLLIDSSFRTESFSKELQEKEVIVGHNDEPIIINEPLIKKQFIPIVVSENINKLNSENKDEVNKRTIDFLEIEHKKDKDVIDEMLDKFIDKLIETLNPDNFNENKDINKFNGITTQPTEINDLLGDIYNYCKSQKSNKNLFINCINMKLPYFLHNRINTELDDNEFKAISYQTQDHKQIFNGKQINSENTKPGDFVIYHKDVNVNSYSIGQVVYVKQSNDSGNITNLNDPVKEVNVNDFYHLPITLKQVGTPDGDSRETADCIEEYNIYPI